MAIENQNESDDGNDKSDDKFSDEDDNEKRRLPGNSSSGTVAVEAMFEKKNSEKNQLAHANRKQDSFSIQVEDYEAEAPAITLEEEEIAPSAIAQKQSNTYAAKKTVAQGMMDIALITANANQLRFIIVYGRNGPTYTLMIMLITISLLLQVGVGLSLIFKGRMDLRGKSKHRNAKRANNVVVVGVFLVTIINIFIASFTVTEVPANPGAGGSSS